MLAAHQPKELSKLSKPTQVRDLHGHLVEVKTILLTPSMIRVGVGFFPKMSIELHPCRALSAVTLGGLFYFNYTDVGVVNAIKMLWTKV